MSEHEKYEPKKYEPTYSVGDKVIVKTSRGEPVDAFIKEIPICFLDRTKGISKIPKIEIFRTLFNLFKLKLLS